MHEAGRICRLIDPTCHSNVEHRCKQSAINSLKVLLAGGGHLPRSDSMVGLGGGHWGNQSAMTLIGERIKSLKVRVVLN